MCKITLVSVIEHVNIHTLPLCIPGIGARLYVSGRLAPVRVDQTADKVPVVEQDELVNHAYERETWARHQLPETFTADTNRTRGSHTHAVCSRYRASVARHL